jgi:hypothetical protein
LGLQISFFEELPLLRTHSISGIPRAFKVFTFFLPILLFFFFFFFFFPPSTDISCQLSAPGKERRVVLLLLDTIAADNNYVKSGLKKNWYGLLVGVRNSSREF